VPLSVFRVDEVGVVQVQDVEQEHRQRDRRPGVLRRGARRRVLERQRPAVLAQRDQLAVEDRGRDRHPGHRRHHLGQPGRDVVQGPGEQPDAPAGQVRLDPDPVKLPLHCRGPVDLGQRVPEGRRAGREHRPDRAADLQAERAQRLTAPAQRGGGHHAQRTAQHHGPADLRHRHLSGPGDGVGHDALQRALAQLAGQQADQEPLLVRCGAAEQLADQRLARGRRTLPGHRADRAEPRVHLG
jgi:hypothetical protein